MEDGTVIRGSGFGACREVLGEVVFNTGMAGYPETLTNPSYNGQILTFTYPLIGNYDVHPDWLESDRIWAEGVIVREVCERPSHWKGTQALDEFLKEFDVPGMSGVDTRALTTKIRDLGAMKGAMVTYTGAEPNVEELLERVKGQPSKSEVDLVAETSRDEVARFNEGGKPGVVLIDCGAKRSLIQGFVEAGLSVVAVPANTPADKIEELGPKGVVISSGPGDPAAVKYLHETVKKLISNYPIMGVGLGHQIIARVSGGKTYKLKFGHRGANQPVKDLETGRVYITSQDHGFAVDADSLEGTGLKVTKVNCNDGTVEGIGHAELPLLSVQYSPDCWDNQHIFDQFVEMVRR